MFQPTDNKDRNGCEKYTRKQNDKLSKRADVFFLKPLKYGNDQYDARNDICNEGNPRMHRKILIIAAMINVYNGDEEAD